MDLTISNNVEESKVVLTFSQPIEKELASFLIEIGFKHSTKHNDVYTADAHKAYQDYAAALQAAINKNANWKSVAVYPSFEPSLDFLSSKLKSGQSWSSRFL